LPQTCTRPTLHYHHHPYCPSLFQNLINFKAWKCCGFESARIRNFCPNLDQVRYGYMAKRGMRHTSTALYFYEASKKTTHKPRAIYKSIFFHISYGFS
jgi:hypothetical protein